MLRLKPLFLAVAFTSLVGNFPIGGASLARGETIGFIERYALAEDREAILDELIAGSEEYYFYHCLHYQVNGEIERAEAVLRQWQNDPQARNSSLLRGIEDRQRLLTYGSSPERTLDYFRDRLGIQLNHAAPPVRGERRYPETLDQDQFQADRLIDEALHRDRGLTRDGFRRLGERFLADQVAGLPVDLHWLLQQVDGPWIDSLDELVIKELQARRPQDRRFGDLPAHRFLTEEQLKRVVDAVPAIAHSDAMVAERLLRLRPDGDEDPSQQPEVRHAYLVRAEAYVSTLPPAFNSLKASMLYRLLEADLAQGNPQRDRFMRYLMLPRHSPIIIPVPRTENQPRANLSEDFTHLALVPPIGDETILVRKYLELFLRDAESTEEFAELVRSDYLNRVFAETKLLYGEGPSDRWYQQLSPAEQQAIKDRVELNLVETNPVRSDADDPSSLTVDVKHVDELIVRVYEINTHAFYRSHDELVHADIDLDGLVATHERRIDYNQPAIRRHRETIDLPELEGRGVWVIDMLGGGLRTRALIRRGDLRYTVGKSANGLELTVLDEDRRPVPDARLLIGSQEFLADDQGRIEAPLMDKATRRTAIVRDDALAVPVLLDHPAESYQLQAAMALHRQQLLPGRTAELIVRPQLRMSDERVSASLLKNVEVAITVTDNDDISSTKRYDDLTFDESAEAVLRFRVPARLTKITATVSGEVVKMADGRVEKLAVSETWEVNGTRQTEQTVDGYLTRDGEVWLLETLGRNGEVVPDVTVNISLFSRFRTQPVEATLQSDASGRATLGKLDGIERINYQASDAQQHTQSLTLDKKVWPDRLHGTVGEPLRLPLAETEVALTERFRLLELRGDRPAADRTELLSQDAGTLVLGGLAAGNYQLIDRHDDRTISVAVTAGPVHNEVAAGTVRHLETPRRDALAIASVERDEEGLSIRLSGKAPLARIHVFASRYIPRTSPLEMLRQDSRIPQVRRVDLPENEYLSGLKLGDEYQYVLRRQYAQKYPGVMLPQPSLLLNPWETDDTKTTSQSAAEGEQPQAPPAEPGAARPEMDAASGQASRLAEVTQTFDFLANGAIVLDNLVPDEDGVIRIPNDQLGSYPFVQIVVTDPATLLQRTVPADLPELETRDLRVPEALAADRPLAFERGVSAAGPDQPFDIQSIGSAQIQLYSSVAELLDLYITLSSDQRLSAFRPLGRWHTMDDAEKRSTYGELACHELHVFLRQHDPDFFESVVTPYLHNKKEKQLIDAWLLGADLTPWTELSRYNTLNAAERAILAREVPAARESILRELRERVALLDIDPETLIRAIESGLAGGRMNLERKLALGEVAQLQTEQLFKEEPSVNFALNGILREKLGDRDMAEKAEAADAKSDRQLGRQRAGADDAYFGSRLARPQQWFFQQLDATKQWAESHWDRTRTAAAGADLIPIDPFWLDWAEAGAGEQTISEHLLLPTGNRHAALFALAVSGLPLEAGEVQLPEEDEAPFMPQHPVAIITKRLNELEPMEGDASLLVGQRFEALGTPPRRPDDETPIEIAPDEFLVQQGYLGQIVITNPTPQPRTMDVLWQIPAGSIPLAGHQATDSQRVELEPFAVKQIAYQFYFPAAGEFLHYPVCVSSDGRVVARGDERQFKVVASPTQSDAETWNAIARNGDAAAIAKFLADANVHRLDISDVLHRLRDKAIYEVVIEALRSARRWHDQVWGYAVLHHDVPQIKTLFASRKDLIAVAGPVLNSELLKIDPIEDQLYEHLEFAPLVRARIHPLRPEPEILNNLFLVQYRALMKNLAYQQQPSNEQQLALTYYLLLQNRIEEAMEHFASASREETAMRLQYDYLGAYLALHQSDYDTASELAGRHAGHPVPRWNQRFREIQNQLQQRNTLVSGAELVSSTPSSDAADGGVDPEAADLAVLDRERRQADAASREPAVDVTVSGQTLKISHRNTDEVTLNFYGVDLELLFSKTPFVQDDLGRMATVRPGKSELVTLDQSSGIANYRIDGNLARQTLLVEAVSGSARSTALYYGGELDTYVSEGFGQLQASDAETGQPVAGAYVKVYGKQPDGAVNFYKDGYTDLRGRFDYASLSTNELENVQRLAILVLDPERGASLHEVAPPTK